ncbi:MAG TPA: hypothetical protein VMT00_16315 [Thermoanaerobaculia bacterium]|nr:hypothetical protein [Thermoanaerobaculia bacterium]
MQSARRALALAAALLAAPLSIDGATFVVPPDFELVQKAEAIVLATVVSAWPRLDANGLIETVTELAVDETIKGAVDGNIRIIHWGGTIGDRWLIATGTPRYTPGRRVLAFLQRDAKGRWTTLDLALGKFDLGFDSRGKELLVRDGEAIAGWDRDGVRHIERLRLAEPFLAFVRAEAHGGTPTLDYWAPADPGSTETPSTTSDGVVAAAFTATQYCLLLGGQAARRTNTSVAWRLAGNQTGLNSDAAVTKGTSAWTDDPGSNVNYSKSATPASGSLNDPFDGEDRIIANDPGNDIAGSFTGSGTVAIAFIGVQGMHNFSGETFITIPGADIVVQDGVGAAVGQNFFDTAMTHELGHTLGFRHSNRSANDQAACVDPLPCSSTAIMNSSLISGLNGNLQAWDRDGVQTLFGSGPVCPLPVITAQPQSARIASGEISTLTVSATSPTPITFQWFRGPRLDTSNPVGGNSASFNTGPVATTTSYWVRLTNSCGNTESITATLRVAETRSRAVRR